MEITSPPAMQRAPRQSPFSSMSPAATSSTTRSCSAPADASIIVVQPSCASEAEDGSHSSLNTISSTHSSSENNSLQERLLPCEPPAREGRATRSFFNFLRSRPAERVEERPRRQPRRRCCCVEEIASNWQMCLAAACTSLLILFLIRLSIIYDRCQQHAHHPKKRAVVLLISDGYGPAGQTLARAVAQAVGQRQEPFYFNERRHSLHEIISQRITPFLGTRKHGKRNVSLNEAGLPDRSFTLPLDEILTGTSRTASASSIVTDSAAGATAFSCALHTYNGAVAVSSDMRPCATVFEAAKMKNWITGLIVKSRITHATPAAFSAHTTWRDFEQDIALQQLGKDGSPLNITMDLLLGGGLSYFLPNNVSSKYTKDNATGKREDGRDLVDEAVNHFGFQYISTRHELLDNNVKLRLPLLGLFSADHMPYEFDRNVSTTPNLYEMVEEGLTLLERAAAENDASPGFLLMIEGSKIDMASHNGDAATSSLEALEYQVAAQTVLAFAKESSMFEYTVISTSDHETGGITLGAQRSGEKLPVYDFYPSTLLRQKSSAAAAALAAATFSNPAEKGLEGKVGLPPDEGAVRAVAASHLGLTGDDALTSDEVAAATVKGITMTELEQVFSGFVSKRARIGFTTHGHTGVDVNVYSWGPGKERLSGNIENTEIGKVLESLLNVTETRKELTRFLQTHMDLRKPNFTQTEATEGPQGRRVRAWKPQS